MTYWVQTEYVCTEYSAENQYYNWQVLSCVVNWE